jgi:peptide/nickel transport system permease protein
MRYMRININRGVIILIILTVFAIIAPLFSPYDPFQSVDTPYQGISLKHLLGTDALGRDIFSQLLVGSRTTLFVSLTAAVISLLISLFLGLASSLKSIYSQIISSIIDSFIVVPPLMIMIFIASIFGSSLYSEILAISLAYWPQIAKIFRAEIISILERAYVEASHALGGKTLWIIRKHVLRNIRHVILSNFIYLVGVSIVSEAVISFLGLSDQRFFSWGMIFYYAFIQGAVYYGLWQWILAPAFLITIIVYMLFESSKDILTK